MPKVGEADPYFGLTRLDYYKLEADRSLHLVRLRLKGKVQGKVLIPYDDVSALLRSLHADQRRAVAANSN